MIDIILFCLPNLDHGNQHLHIFFICKNKLVTSVVYHTIYK